MKTVTLKQFANDLNYFYHENIGMVISINDAYEIMEDLYDTEIFEIDNSSIKLYYN